MTTSDTPKSQHAPKSRARYLVALGIVFMLPVIGYLAYDLAKPLVDPCESLFRQTQLSLDSKISVLKSEGHMVLKPEKIQELTERSQFIALNLKACCTVLNAGKLDPEQFLDCKAKSFEFEQGVDKVITIINQNPQPENPAPVSRQIDEILLDVNSTSKQFNERIVTLNRQQQFERLSYEEKQDLEINERESEPNDTLLMPNRMPLSTWIQAQVGTNNDKDVYRFTVPPIHRDWVSIELRNQSTGLRPNVTYYNNDKAQLDNRGNDTHGGNVRLSFVTQPGADYYLQVSSLFGATQGQYALQVYANKSYDHFEPNQTILTAKEVPLGSPQTLNLMDGRDIDYFWFEAERSSSIEVRFDNLSTDIEPVIRVFDENKSHLTTQGNPTQGGNLTVKFDVDVGKRYYIDIHDQHTRFRGKYQLTLAYTD